VWEFLKEYIFSFYQSVWFDNENTYNYKQIIKLVEVHGDNLKVQLHPKSKCAVLCNKGINNAIAILSCWYAGMIPIPLSRNYGVNHCKSIIELTEPDIVILDDTLNYQFNFKYDLSTKVFEGELYSTQQEDVLADISLIMCTSGTTGNPKRIMITVEGLKKNILSIADYFKINNNDTILIARPLYHCAVMTGEFLLALCKGLNIGFYDSIYNPINIISFASAHNITVLCGTPTLFHHISLFSQKRKVAPSCISKIAISGECLTKEVAANIRAVFPKATIYSVYGLTEASPRVSFLPPDQFDNIPESVGIPLRDVSIKIIDDTSGIECPVNTPGLIMIKSPSMMKGYYRDRVATDIALKDGWFNTRDVGYVDEKGNLYILCRADDMIIKAGMNIYPKEIENALKTLPEVEDAVAYAVKSETGHGIAVDAVLSEPLNVKTLMKRFSDVLPAYLMPNQVNILEKLTRNASGKAIRPRSR